MTYITEPIIEAGLKLIYEQYPDIVDIKDRLDDNDFAVLKKTKSFLQALYDATLFIEGHYITLDRVLPTIE